MTFINKYWPHVLTIVAALVAFIDPSVKAYDVAHPNTVVAILLSAVIAAYHAIPPAQKQ